MLLVRGPLVCRGGGDACVVLGCIRHRLQTDAAAASSMDRSRLRLSYAQLDDWHVPRDLHERTGYAFEAKAIASSWMTTLEHRHSFDRPRRGQGNRHDAVAAPPRLDPLGADGLAVWKAQMATRGGGGKLVGSFEFLPE